MDEISCFYRVWGFLVLINPIRVAVNKNKAICILFWNKMFKLQHMNSVLQMTPKKLNLFVDFAVRVFALSRCNKHPDIERCSRNLSANFRNTIQDIEVLAKLFYWDTISRTSWTFSKSSNYIFLRSNSLLTSEQTWHFDDIKLSSNYNVCWTALPLKSLGSVWFYIWKEINIFIQQDGITIIWSDS